MCANIGADANFTDDVLLTTKTRAGARLTVETLFLPHVFHLALFFRDGLQQTLSSNNAVKRSLDLRKHRSISLYLRCTR